jgi:hypothetical protein
MAPKAEPKPPELIRQDEIRHDNVNSTTSILTSPDGDVATVHLGWIITVGPMNDDDETIIQDEDFVINDEDMATLRDGDQVLNNGAESRDWVHVESDPGAVRGYALAKASALLADYSNGNRRQPRTPQPFKAQDEPPPSNKVTEAPKPDNTPAPKPAV